MPHADEITLRIGAREVTFGKDERLIGLRPERVAGFGLTSAVTAHEIDVPHAMLGGFALCAVPRRLHFHGGGAGQLAPALSRSSRP